MREQGKIRNVTELARYRVGDVCWWLTLRPVSARQSLPEEDNWMADHHPKVLYEWGSHRPLWGKASLPKLHHIDFGHIMALLTHRLVIEEFPICDIVRSTNTGEFFYSNEDDEWMPESLLLTTKIQACREKSRVLRMVKKWIDQNHHE